jgi:hypothetical protein
MRSCLPLTPSQPAYAGTRIDVGPFVEEGFYSLSIHTAMIHPRLSIAAEGQHRVYGTRSESDLASAVLKAFEQQRYSQVRSAVAMDVTKCGPRR